MDRFRPGQPIVDRSVDRSERVVLDAVPVTVVRDGPELIAVYLMAGARCKRWSGERGGPRGRQLVHWDGGYEDWTWSRTNALILYRPGDPFSIWSAWNADDWVHAWWYVNLEDPWRRTSIGFDSRDRDLDLWAEPDAREWHWKDEDELAWAVAQGRFSAADAAAIRADGEVALARIRSGEPPFDPSAASWRPDPAWSRPTLPLDWMTYERSDRREPAT